MECGGILREFVTIPRVLYKLESCAPLLPIHNCQYYSRSGTI